MIPIGVPVLDAYLTAFESRDLTACLECFSERSMIEFGTTQYRGPEGIKRWHEERWNANMKLLRIDSIDRVNDLITIEGAVTSDRLKTWRLATLAIRAKLRLENERIIEARFGLKP